MPSGSTGCKRSAQVVTFAAVGRRHRVGFVRRAPTKHGGVVDLRVAHMRPSHVWWWHSHVQPVIDADPNRVDRHWNWLLYSAFVLVTGLALLLGRIHALGQ